MTETTTTPRAPAGLAQRGRRLWRRIVSTYDLGPDELELLCEVCRSLDRVETLQEALRAEPVVVKGSRGQPRPHPLAAELRAEVTLCAKLLAQLGIPDEDEDAGGNWRAMTPSERGRKAALRRWKGRGARPMEG